LQLAFGEQAFRGHVSSTCPLNACSPNTKASPVFVSSAAARLGHTGAVAGLASLLQGLLSLYQEIIPAGGNPETSLPAFRNSRLQLAPTPRYWLRNREDGPRRALVAVTAVDGSCSQVLLEGWDGTRPESAAAERRAPLGPCRELLFPLVADSLTELAAELDLLQQRLRAAGNNLPGLAAEYCIRITLETTLPFGMALVAADTEQLEALIEQARICLQRNGELTDLPIHLRDRLFFSTRPLVQQGRIAFVFPGSGNHYPERPVSTRAVLGRYGQCKVQ